MEIKERNGSMTVKFISCFLIHVEYRTVSFEQKKCQIEKQKFQLSSSFLLHYILITLIGS